jgi:cytochrome b involved in lipid metabolism
MVDMPEYTIEQVLENDGNEGKKLWILIKGSIYDVTSFSHPGGRDALQEDHGDDRWEEFKSIHSKETIKSAEKYKIGKLKLKENIKLETKDNKENKEKTQVQTPTWIPFLVLFIAYALFFKYDILGFFKRN